MSRNLRRRPRISYQEIEEPDYDEYVFCDQCGFEVYEYCSVHGPLLVLPDDKVPTPTGFPSFVPRAALTIPHEFLHLNRSTIPDAGLGVFASLTLPKGVRLGPYRGQKIPEPTSEYCWQIYDGSNHRRPLHVVDAGDPQRSNWMRYVNCSRFWAEQNLVAYQYQGELYYRTVKIIPRMTELLVFYGAEFARALRIDLRLYDKITAITVPPPKNNQASMANAASEQGKVIEPVACNIDLPITSDDKNRENSNKTVKKQTKDHNDEFMPYLDSTLEVTKSVQLNNNESPKLVMKDASFIKTMDYSCTICKFKTNNEKYLKSHLKAHSAARQFTCDLCCHITPEKRKLVEHMRTHTGENVCCEICDKKFTARSGLTYHMQLHTGIKPHECKICSKKFSKSGDLKKHMRIHTGEKPYSCVVCNQKFSQRQNLNIHMRTHTGEKPYTCEVCNQSFSERGKLKVHMRTHTGEKPYTCEVCNQKFSQRSNLISHMRTHTGEKPFSCEVCNHKFSHSYNLKTHTRIHTGETPYACEICNVKYSDKSHLNTHIRRIHKSEKH